MNRLVRSLPIVGLAIVMLSGCGSETSSVTLTTADPSVPDSAAAPATTIATVTTDAPVPTDAPPATTPPTTAPPTTAPVTTVVPGPEIRTRSVDLPSGSFTVGADDLFIQHADGDLWLHPGILAETPGEAFRVIDFGDPRDEVTEGPGPNEVEQVAGVFDGAVYYSACCEPAAGIVLAATGPDAEPATLTFGYTPTFSPDGTRLATANSYALEVIDLAGSTSTSRTLNEGDAVSGYRNAWDVTWADDSSVVLLYADDAGFALQSIDADSLEESSPPTQLGVMFDPIESIDVRFAGHGPNGEIALGFTGETTTVIRLFDTTTLTELPDLERALPTAATYVRLAPDGVGVLWVDGGQLWYQPADGEPRNLGIDSLAAWFAV